MGAWFASTTSRTRSTKQTHRAEAAQLGSNPDHEAKRDSLEMASNLPAARRRDLDADQDGGANVLRKGVGGGRGAQWWGGSVGPHAANRQWALPVVVAAP